MMPSGAYDKQATAIDAGIDFLRREANSIFFLALTPIVIQGGAAWYVLHYPVEQTQAFLLTMLIAAANAWYLTTLVLFALTGLGGESSLFQLAKRSLVSLPKVFLSYTLLWAVFGLSLMLPPLMVVLFFLLWAPAFCAGEVALTQQVSKQRDEQAEEAAGVFKGQSVFGLGGFRSMRFAQTNLLATGGILLAFWLIGSLPSALLWTLSQGFTRVNLQLLQAFITAGLDAAATAVWVGIFVALLPLAALKELGVNRSEFSGRHYRFHRNKIVQVAALVLCVVCTWMVYRSAASANMMPPGAWAKVASLTAEDDRIDVVLKFKDENHHLRWFTPEALRWEDERGDRFKPDSVVVRAMDGEAILRTNIGPIREPVFVHLRFNRVSTEGRFSIYYTGGGVDKLISSGRDGRL